MGQPRLCRQKRNRPQQGLFCAPVPLGQRHKLNPRSVRGGMRIQLAQAQALIANMNNNNNSNNNAPRRHA